MYVVYVKDHPTQPLTAFGRFSEARACADLNAEERVQQVVVFHVPVYGDRVAAVAMFESDGGEPVYVRLPQRALDDGTEEYEEVGH
jgi:hypothetical protein